MALNIIAKSNQPMYVGEPNLRRLQITGLRITMYLLIFLLLSFVNCEEPSNQNAERKSNDIDISAVSLKMYRLLFNTKRQDHRSAIKQIQRHSNNEKRDSLILSLIGTMQKTIGKARVEIERSGFIPGMPFPQDEKADLKDALSTVLENAAFFSDLALYFPDAVGKQYKSNKELQTVMNWALLFANTTRFYDEKTTKLMHLVGQELGLVEKEPTYINPYSSKLRASYAKIDEVYEKKKDADKRQKQETKRKKLKGPKLQGGTRKEL